MYDFIIPQELNIADRIGKFTFAQWGFLAGGMLVIMTMLISKNIPMWVSILVGVPVVVLCLFLAFFRKYDMPMYEYLIVLMVYKTLPQEMIYSATESEIELDEFDDNAEVEENLIIA
ncbi:PrgI family protein [Priestia sp. SB1]|uniref:PrgI family protein n=1 Tax=Priestia aryabhattai TaxID=412384 RepID=A0AAX6NCY6_PRIAR|nr:PrgI family protein [Priestia aryabhattai]MDU9693758.1 PrgI family protein [Priestia aryabhattai]NGY88978.1 PrgI family protein [Priestia megaterium]